MPNRKGLLAPQNTFLDTIATRFDGTQEWEDGRVNIGVAVSPSPAPTTRANGTDKPPNANFIIPKSAFVIRAPESHQNQGVTVTYAHQENGISDLIIMLSPQDHGLQGEIGSLSQLQNRIGSMQVSPDSNSESVASRCAQELVLVTEESSKLSLQKQHSVLCSESSSPTLPQDTQIHERKLIQTLEPIEEVATSPPTSSREAVTLSSDMKRVSWVDESEILASNKNRNSKETKRENVRKSNGQRNRSPKKQGVNMDATDELGGRGKRVGDKPRIPCIPSSAVAGDHPISCDFYRRKMLNEYYCNNPTDNWYGYSSIQKYAGQKVVKKIAAEQKRLEEDMSNRRKTEIWILGNDTDDYMSPAIPLRKKTTRLKPIQIV